MKSKVLILTTTEPGNKFPENFSCWCAGALEAKGCDTIVEIISLEKLTDSLPSKPLKIQKEKLKQLQDILSETEKLVLILPEHNNMIPVGLDNFMELLSTKRKQYESCKLVAIVTDPPTDKDDDRQNHFLFRYPLHKLDTLFGSTFSANRIQINNSPTGDMCPLFLKSYGDLCALIQQILD